MDEGKNWASADEQLNYTVKVEMTARQLRLVVNALDMFVRLGIGQVEEVVDNLDLMFDLTPEKKDDLRVLVNRIKTEIINQPVNGSYGIGNRKVKKPVHDSYDLYKALAKVIATAERHERFSVWHDGNIVRYGDQPSPTMSFTRGETEVAVDANRDH